jgi:tetratricopeptide (TPR) repeat protein
MTSLLFVLFAIPIPSANQQWTRVTTPRFTIVSATGERETRELARNLETLASALGDLQPGANLPPTRVIVFARRGEAQPYLDLLLNHAQSNATGVFVLQRGAATMLVDVSRGRVADRTPYHELVHYLLSAAPQHPPLWLEEGIAEYYSNAQIHGGEIRVGLPVREHLVRLRRPNLLRARDVLAMTRSSPRATDLMFYAESWAIVDWMLRTSRRSFDAFVHDVASGTPSDVALVTHFHTRPDGLDDIIRNYTPQVTSFILALGLRANVTSIEKATHAEFVFELGRLLALVDRAASDADLHLHAVLEEAPQHALALAWLGRLRSRATKDEEAFALFERAIASDPNDGTIHLMYAEALLRPEIGGGLAETTEHTSADIPRFRHARELAEKASALHADETRTLGAIGTSYIVEDDATPGIAPLERAHALFPQRTDYPLHLLSLYLRSGERAKADALAAQLETTLAPPLKAVMYAVLLREELACINTLIDTGEHEGAVDALRNLVASTKDPNTKQQLAQQLAMLEQAP